MEHRHTNGVVHEHQNRAEECYQELAKVLERYQCTLRAVLQVQADGIVQPVVQVAEMNMAVQEDTHGSNHHQ